MNATHKRTLLASCRRFLGVPLQKCMDSGIDIYVGKALPTGFDPAIAAEVLKIECRRLRKASFIKADHERMERKKRAYAAGHRATLRSARP